MWVLSLGLKQLNTLLILYKETSTTNILSIRILAILYSLDRLFKKLLILFYTPPVSCVKKCTYFNPFRQKDNSSKLSVSHDLSQNEEVQE